MTRNRTLLVVLTLVGLVGAVARLYLIDARPLHYDEGVHMQVAWELLTSGTYTYTGYTHGPPLMYAAAGLFRILGVDITVGRALVAVLSLGAFPALYFLREELPWTSLGVAGFVLAVHPKMLFVSRFFRNDVLVATFALLSIGLYARYRRTPTRTTAVLLGVSLSLVTAAKEIGYVVLASLLTAVVLVAHFDRRFSTDDSYTASRRLYAVKAGLDDYLPAKHAGLFLAAYVGSLVVLFSGWPPDPLSAPTTLVEGLNVWIGRSERAAYEADPLYYLGPLLKEMTVVFGFALVGCLGTLLDARSSWFRWFFVVWAGVTGLVLSLHDHQWPWLGVHVFVPTAVLAGLGVADVLRVARVAVDETKIAVPSAARYAVAALVVAVLVVPTLQGAAAGEPREIDGITGPDYRDVERTAFAFAGEEATRLGCQVDVGPDVEWQPAAWYLRDADYRFLEAWNDSVTQSPNVLVTTRRMENVTGADLRTFSNEVEEWYVYAPREECS